MHLPAYGYPVATLGNTVINYLRSKARSVYGQAVLTGRLDTCSWDSVRKFLIDNFYNRDPLSVAKLTELKMTAGQRISDFIADFENATRKCYGIFTDKENGPVQDILKQIFINNLTPTHRKRALKLDIKSCPSFDAITKHLEECEYADRLCPEIPNQCLSANNCNERPDNVTAAVTQIETAAGPPSETETSEHSDNCSVSRLKKEVKFIRKEVFKMKQQCHKPQAEYRSVCSGDSAPVEQSWRKQNQNCCSDRVELMENKISSLQEGFQEQANALKQLGQDLFDLKERYKKGFDLVRDEMGELNQIVSEQSSSLVKQTADTVLKRQVSHQNSELTDIRNDLASVDKNLRTTLANFELEVNTRLSKASADSEQTNTKLTTLKNETETNYNCLKTRLASSGVDNHRRQTAKTTKASSKPVLMTSVEFDSDGYVKDYEAATAKTAPAIRRSVGAVNTSTGPPKMANDQSGQKESPNECHSSTVPHKFNRFGLKLVDVKADGNCLFRALSEQLYGEEQHHDTLREYVCNVVSDNVDHFSDFLDCKTDDFLHDLACPGAYAGNEAISAFSKAQGVQVFIHQFRHRNVLRVSPDAKTERDGPGCGPRQIHIAYDSGKQHYYSVRTDDWFYEPPDIRQLMKDHGIEVVDI